MPVTDLHVEVLRDLLTGRHEAAQQAIAQGGEGLGDMDALLQMSLGAAARRFFAPSWNMPMVIEFVALVRNDYAGVSLPFGAPDAERELRRALGDTVPPPRDVQAAGMARMCLLRVLKDVLELDDDGVAGLLAEARPMADRALAEAGNDVQTDVGVAGEPDADDGERSPGIRPGAGVSQQAGASSQVGRDRNADGQRETTLEQRVRALEERQARRDAEHEAEIGRLRSQILAMAARIDALEAGRESAPGPGPDDGAPSAFGDWRGSNGSNHLGLPDCAR
jgi:hypothetical protein